MSGSDTKAAASAGDLAVGGLRKLRHVAQLLAGLHEVGCERDAAGNRELHFDDYVLLVLLALMNPMVDSVRMLQAASRLPGVQKALKIKPFSLGSFSESCRVFEPERLTEVVAALWKGLPATHRPELLKALPGKLTLVDSSVLHTLCTVAEAMFLPKGEGHRHAFRLHLQFDVDGHVPGPWELTDARNTGKSDEKAVLRSKLRPGHTYVMDRWYAQFTLWNDIKLAGSSYVCRVRDNSVYEIDAEHPLTAADREAGVLSDQLVRIGLSKKPDQRPDHPIRLVCVACEPHAKRGKTPRKADGRSGQTGPTSDGTLRIVTDLLEPPAHVIAFLYRYRWTIEVFFRFLKQTLGARRLLSTKTEGVMIELYAAVILCLLVGQVTGLRPGKLVVRMMAFYFQGWASEEDLLKLIADEHARRTRDAKTH